MHEMNKLKKKKKKGPRSHCKTIISEFINKCDRMHTVPNLPNSRASTLKKRPLRRHKDHQYVACLLLQESTAWLEYSDGLV